MKKTVAAAVFVALASFTLGAQEHGKAKPHAIFDAMKPLVGTWEATGKGDKVRTVIAMAASGTAMIETLMPDTVSMINMIHPDGEAVMMTHYCAGANQPRYRATKIEAGSIVFSFVDGTNIGDSYMSGVTWKLIDENHFTQEWTNTEGGKQTKFAFEYTRVK